MTSLAARSVALVEALLSFLGEDRDEPSAFFPRSGVSQISKM
jgi:hypothetical protein